jgi:hypothetical protein
MSTTDDKKPGKRTLRPKPMFALEQPLAPPKSKTKKEKKEKKKVPAPSTPPKLLASTNTTTTTTMTTTTPSTTNANNNTKKPTSLTNLPKPLAPPPADPHSGIVAIMVAPSVFDDDTIANISAAQAVTVRHYQSFFYSIRAKVCISSIPLFPLSSFLFPLPPTLSLI